MLRRNLSLLKTRNFTCSSISRFSKKCPNYPPIFFSTSSEEFGTKKSSFRRRAIPVVLLSLTGGYALSAVNDLAIFHGCSRGGVRAKGASLETEFQTPVLAMRRNLIGELNAHSRAPPPSLVYVALDYTSPNRVSSKAIEKASQNQKITEALGEPILRGSWYDATVAFGYRRNTVSCTFPVSGPQGSGIFQLKAVRTGDDSLFSFLRHNDWDILVMEALLHVPTEGEEHETFRVSLTGITPTAVPVECGDCRSAASKTLE